RGLTPARDRAGGFGPGIALMPLPPGGKLRLRGWHNGPAQDRAGYRRPAGSGRPGRGKNRLMKDPGVLGDSKGSATSLTLLERVRRRDQAAWERLVSLYTPLVYHWCLRHGLQPADAEEVSQEVFLAVARGIGDFRHDREGDSFRGWLRTITRNKVCDHR